MFVTFTLCCTEMRWIFIKSWWSFIDKLCIIRICWQKLCVIGITYFPSHPDFIQKTGIWKLDTFPNFKMLTQALTNWPTCQQNASSEGQQRRNLIHQITSRAVGRSENSRVGASSNVVGIICLPFPPWDEVNWYVTIWGGRVGGVGGALSPRPPGYDSPLTSMLKANNYLSV